MRVIAGGEPEEHDNVWITSSGERLHVAWTCTPLPRVDQRTLFLLSGSDVTERKSREMELGRARDFLQAVITTIPSLLVDRRPRRADRRERRQPPVHEDVRLDDRGGERAATSSSSCIRTTSTSCAWRSRPRRTGSLAPTSRRAGCGRTATRAWWRGRPRPRGDRDGRSPGAAHGHGHHRAQAAGGGDPGLADAPARSREQRAPPARAQPARRRPAAARRALRPAPADRVEAPRRIPTRRRSSSGRPATELAHALEELRELARGIHPAVLTDRGLGPALGVARRARADPDRPARSDRAARPLRSRPRPTTSSPKRSRTSSSTRGPRRRSCASPRTTACSPSRSRTTASAEPIRTPASGLRGLVDRVSALDGSLVVESPPGEGTSVRAEIPLHETAGRGGGSEEPGRGQRTGS